jgi:hypothetical protein
VNDNWEHFISLCVIFIRYSLRHQHGSGSCFQFRVQVSLETWETLSSQHHDEGQFVKTLQLFCWPKNSVSKQPEDSLSSSQKPDMRHYPEREQYSSVIASYLFVVTFCLISQMCLSIPSSILFHGFPTKIQYTLPPHPLWFNINIGLFGDKYKIQDLLIYNFLHRNVTVHSFGSSTLLATQISNETHIPLIRTQHPHIFMPKNFRIPIHLTSSTLCNVSRLSNNLWQTIYLETRTFRLQYHTIHAPRHVKSFIFSQNISTFHSHPRLRSLIYIF